MTITFSIDQLAEVAQQILDQNPHKVILFNGEMGDEKIFITNIEDSFRI